MMSTDESLCLKLEAMPKNVGVARRAVADLAKDFGIEEPTLGDVMTVVSEACSNVVEHAYPGRSGQFEVEALRAGSHLLIVVRDFGEGMQARVKTVESSMQLGLGLIAMLSSHFQISGGANGTEVRMQFPLPS
jgi:anti-sigma regulatory factor (Ser/Thr protein kinase)